MTWTHSTLSSIVLACALACAANATIAHAQPLPQASARPTPAPSGVDTPSAEPSEGRPERAATRASALSQTTTATGAVAQGQALTLSDALARAIAKNRDVLVERESAALADAGIERAQGAYDPTLRADIRYRDQQIPVTTLLNGAPAGDLATRQTGLTSSASFSTLLSTGANVTFSASMGRNTDNSFITLIAPAWSTSLGVEARQPLLQNRQIDPARRAIKVARVTRERSDISLRRTLLETVNGIEQAYWTLVAAQRNVDIQQHNIDLAEQQRSDVAVRIEAKTAPESDIAQPTAEIARRRGELYAAEEARERAENALKLLMLEGASDPLWSMPLRASDAPDIAPMSIDLTAALRDAQENRPELADLTARVQLSDIDIQSARDRLKPQLDLVAAYTSRGLAGALNDWARPIIPGIPLVVPDSTSGGFGQSLANLAKQRFPDASVGVSLTIPLGNHVAKADLATAQTTKTQTLTIQERESQRIASEVRNAAVALQTAAQRIDAARAGRDAAEVQLRAEQDRFTAGLTTTFLVLTRQNDLIVAEQAEVNALTAYRRALAELARARGTLLRDRSVDLTPSPPRPPSPPS
jgi:outer membrane protein